MQIVSMYKYGRLRPIQSIEKLPPNDRRATTRSVDSAIKEKLKVLREFDIVDDRNESSIEAKMRKAIADNPDTHFDRVLDKFARKLIDEKLEADIYG